MVTEGIRRNQNIGKMILCPIRLFPIFIITFLGTSVMTRGHSGSQLEEWVSFIDDPQWISTKTVSVEAEMAALKFKDMVEHKVYVALDGLKKEQPVEVQKSSLFSLLSISCSDPGRRVLRSQRLAKLLLRALQDLDFDDNASKQAALSLYKILTKEEGIADKTTLGCNLEEEGLDASIRSIGDISSNLPVVDIPSGTCQSKELDRPPSKVLEEQEETLYGSEARNRGVADIPGYTCQCKELDRPPSPVLKQQEGNLAARKARVQRDDDEVRLYLVKIFFAYACFFLLVVPPFIGWAFP